MEENKRISSQTLITGINVQKGFQPDNLKMVYDHNGVIICIEMDVSAINEAQASLNMILKHNRRADKTGKWMFKDGVVVKRTYTEEEQNKRKMKSRACCNLSGIKLVYDDSQLRLGIISDENKQKLTEKDALCVESRYPQTIVGQNISEQVDV
ncbi:tail fiber assembly protein [Escherichia coli]|uniref:tail fiber assembly protein n=1 Tax=Escherichia coli TaxID=562 RepID=UPI00249F443A|nr:tail fiber assembly protein [Escherichia coli]WHB53814.1 tail fiber assembly protein [Escherichia coli]